MRNSLLQKTVQMISVVVVGYTGYASAQINSNGELERLRRQLSQLQSEESSLSRQASDLGFQVDSVSREVSRSQSDFREAERTLERARAELRNLDRDIDQLHRQLQEARRQRDQQIQQLGSQIGGLQNAINQTQNDLNRISIELSQINSQRNPARINVLQQEIAGQQSERNTRAQQAAGNAQKIREMEADPGCKDSSSCLAVVRVLKTNQASLDARVAEVDQQLSGRISEIARLQDIERQVGAKEIQRNQLANQANSLVASLSQAQNHLRDLQNRPLQEESRLAEAQSRQNNLRSQIDSIQRQLDNHRRLLTAREADLRNLLRQQDDVQRKLSQVHLQIQDVQRQIDQLDRGGHRTILAGTKLGSSQIDQILQSGDRLVWMEAADANSQVQNLRAERAVTLLIDTVNFSQVQPLTVLALEILVRGGTEVTLVGNIQVLASRPEASGLMATCDRPTSSPQGQIALCH